MKSTNQAEDFRKNAAKRFRQQKIQITKKPLILTQDSGFFVAMLGFTTKKFLG